MRKGEGGKEGGNKEGMGGREGRREEMRKGGREGAEEGGRGREINVVEVNQSIIVQFRNQSNNHQSKRRRISK